MSKTTLIVGVVIILAILGIAAYSQKTSERATDENQNVPAEEFSLPNPSNSDDIDSLERDANATNLEGIDAGLDTSLEAEYTKE